MDDITYLATEEGWLYLAAVMDLASRRIVGWSMSETIDAKLVCGALRSAYWQRKLSAGLLVHRSWKSICKPRVLSLSGGLRDHDVDEQKADCWDNAAMESFFKTLKVERIYQVRYKIRAQARLDIVDCIEGFYSRVRVHTAIGYLAPVDRERSLLVA